MTQCLCYSVRGMRQDAAAKATRRGWPDVPQKHDTRTYSPAQVYPSLTLSPGDQYLLPAFVLPGPSDILVLLLLTYQDHGSTTKEAEPPASAVDRSFEENLSGLSSWCRHL